MAPAQRKTRAPGTGPAGKLVAAGARLRRELAALHFAQPVTHVYDPTDYAGRAHRAYLRRYANTPKRVIFLGMNPGPFGMAQTGVPFGDVARVRDWMGIEAPLGRLPREHPKRPIQGFGCTRSEVSGARLWGAIEEHWKRPERFFARHFVANYCPLAFMEESGRNRTPDKLPASERDPLYAACDRHLRRMVSLLEPRWLVGIGVFAAARARAALAEADTSETTPEIASILHPSPASPLANRGWAAEAARQLRELGLCAVE